MELDNLKKSIQEYKQQLAQVETALTSLGDSNDENRGDLIDLKDQLQQLIDLTQDSLNQVNENSNEETNNGLDAEFALFMSEMEKDGVVKNKSSSNSNPAVADDLEKLEGTKCRAPHVHQWGDTMYHNALVCSVIPTDEDQNFEEIMVKVMFINPTHEEMLPCPYLMEGSCKFDDDKCKFSHGKIVSFASLQEYVQPNFESVRIDSKVLAKQKNKLWGRATIKRIRGEKYFVKFDSNREEVRLELQDVLPLGSDEEDNDDDNLSSDSDLDKEDIINMSLMNTPASQALGDWEKHTKGFGSKMMQKMGYVVGTGLGRYSDGRIEPVPAVCLPPGRSLDHCMHLKEKAGGDKDLFSVEKKLKRLQKKQEQRNTKAYEKGKQEVDVFNFINHTISKPKQENPGTSKCKHRQEIKKESSRNLNIASLQIEEDIKKIERDVYKIRESLTRHSDANSQVHKSLKQKLTIKLNEIHGLKDKAGNISNEQNVRTFKKKITVF